MAEKKERLFSLDALRGLDMLFLCIAQPLLMTIAESWGFNDVTAHPFMRQFEHYWGGFTAYDLIMPLFIFMCGAAIPFALPKRLDAEHRPTSAFWKHIAGRFVLLWILGMMCQGRLLSFNPHRFYYFTNTLQAIAVGYVIAALVMLIRRRAVQIAIPFILAAVYGLSLHLYGDYSASGNLAMKVDMLFVRAFQPAGHDTSTYTWYLTSLMFGAMTLCGMNASQILLSAQTPWRKVQTLVILGVALQLGGWVLEWCGVPCIKHIFTVSFTAQAMGVSVLLLAALYIVNDIWKLRRGWGLVILFGQSSLAAYVLGEIFRSVPRAASIAVLGGLSKRLGAPWKPVIIELGLGLAIIFALLVWRRWRAPK